MENKELNKFKKKIILRTILKQSINGISVALILEGIVLIVFKLCKVRIILPLHICIPLAIAIGLSALLIKMYWPNEKYIAKLVDENCKLNEKIKTAEEFKDVETPMIKLQREDANKSLEKIQPKDLKIKFSILTIALCIFGAGLLITGSVLPDKYKAKDPEVSSSEVSSSESSSEESSEEQSEDSTDTENSTDSEGGQSESDSIDDMFDDLKDQIDNADIDEQTKEDLKNQLDQLQEDLKNDSTQEEVEEDINQTEEDINQTIEESKENTDDEEQKDNLDEINQTIQDTLEQIKDQISQGESGSEDEGEGSSSDSGAGDSGEEGDSGEDSGDMAGSGAGAESGNQIYAADDLIYDPNTNSYVTYGDLIAYYYEQVVAGMAEGDMPEDLEELIADYFASLYYDGNQN